MSRLGSKTVYLQSRRGDSRQRVAEKGRTTAEQELLRKNNVNSGGERRGARISGPFWRAAKNEGRLLGGDRTPTILSKCACAS